MSEWITCNSCFCQPSQDKHFNLTNCGHMFCDECLNKSGSQRCSVCKIDCNALDLSSQLRPDIALYFTNPLDLQRKFLKDIQKVLDFQNGHLSRQLLYHKRLSSKTKQIADEYKNTYNQKKELERTLERYRQELNQQHELYRQECEKNKNNVGSSKELEALRRENAALKNELNQLKSPTIRSQTPQFGNSTQTFNFRNNYRQNTETISPYDIRGSIISNPATSRSSLQNSLINTRISNSRATTPNIVNLGINTPNSSISNRSQVRNFSRGQNSFLNHQSPEMSVFRIPDQPISTSQTSSIRLPRAQVPLLRRARVSPYSPKNN